MINYFFNILPLDIQKYIYEIRLSILLEKIYYNKIQDKKKLIKYIKNINLLTINTNIFNENNEYTNITYHNPYSKTLDFLANKACTILSNNDDKNWWLFNFIRPIERGLIIYNNWFNFINNDIIGINHEICYYKIKRSYFILIDKFRVAENPLILGIY